MNPVLRPKTWRWQTLSTASLLVASLWGCAATPAPPAAPAPPSLGAAPTADLRAVLPAYRWQLAEATYVRRQPIAALSPKAERPLLLNFSADGRIGIRGGCNQMGGSYSLSAGGMLTVSDLIATRMACETALMQIDTTLSGALAQPVQLSLLRPEANASANAAPRLQLTTGDQTRLVFVGQATSP